ncbi:hypothetical protein E4T50_12137 [Aureobasidium sp. EXF-12298]|nr:hypothetical protein E4T50_12137 [Aureobasidium sp. EXF-12298]
MTPNPRFHRTQTSTQASNEAAKTEKPLESPPRELKTLTLGCKIGFILVYPRYHIANSDIEGTAKNIVRNALASNTFTGNDCADCKGTHEYKLPVSMQDPHEDDKKQNQYWKVDIDPNAHLHDEEFESLTGRYYVVGIQIISRVFKFHNRTACPGDKFASPIDGNYIYHNHHERRAQHHWAVEVKAVDQALKTLSKKPNYRVLTNEFTDFKVHVGNVDHGVHMDVARSLLAIFTAFERQFDAINTTTRIGGGVRGEPAPVASRPKLGYKYISDDFTEIQQEAGEGCKPMSSVNMSYLKLQGIGSGYDIRNFLRIYLKGDLSRVQLQKFLDNELITHKNTVLDVSRVWDDKLIAYNPEYVRKYCMKKPTVAFRSHAGTLDSNEQIAWMDLCGVLTEYCYLFNLRAVHNWTRRRWTKPHNQYTILSILEHLDGENNDTYAHYERVMTPIKNPEPTLDQAHISCIFAEWEAEKLHSDPLKSTLVPRAVLRNNLYHKMAENVRDKVKHKFDMGLYGKFPMDTVIPFIEDHYGKKVSLKGGWQDLVLHTK